MRLAASFIMLSSSESRRWDDQSVCSATAAVVVTQSDRGNFTVMSNSVGGAAAVPNFHSLTKYVTDIHISLWLKHDSKTTRRWM